VDAAPNDYALLGVVQFRHRLDAYVKDLAGMNQDMIYFTNDIALRVGLAWPASFAIPLAKAIAATVFVRYFLDNIFGAVVALVVGLA